MVTKLIKYIKQQDRCVFENEFAITSSYLGKHLQFILEDEARATAKAKEIIRMVALKQLELAHSQPDKKQSANIISGVLALYVLTLSNVAQLSPPQ